MKPGKTFKKDEKQIQEIGKNEKRGEKAKKWKTIWKKTFYNRGPPKHQDTQLGSKNLPQ